MKYLDIKATVVPSPDGISVLCCGKEFPATGSLSRHLIDTHSALRHFHPDGKPDCPLFLEVPFDPS